MKSDEERIKIEIDKLIYQFQTISQTPAYREIIVFLINEIAELKIKVNDLEDKKTFEGGG